MSANPNPTRIPDEIWWLWEKCYLVIPGVRLGGIFADKVCYHNFVNANKIKWPDAYCIKLPLDLKGDFTKARAIDLTMSTAEMIKRTTLLKNSALHPEDNRLFGVREFYGTLDGKVVYGLTKSDENGPWSRSTSDTSHLWHIHASFFTFYCDNALAMAAFYSVISGESWEDWKERMAIPNQPADMQVATYTNAYNASSLLRGLAGKGVQADGTVKQRDEKGNFINDVKPQDIIDAIAQKVIDQLAAEGWIKPGPDGGISAGEVAKISETVARGLIVGSKVIPPDAV